MERCLLGKASERKFRLFCVACCRRIWHLLKDDRSKKLVEVLEQFADRETDQAAVRKAVSEALSAKAVSGTLAARTAIVAARDSCMVAVRGWWETALGAGRAVKAHGGKQKWAAEMQAQAALIRDLSGPMLFRRVIFLPRWLSWHDRLIVSMARQMYDSRDFADMPILADALEEAGCTDQDILAHCRSGGEHVRGCWVVDLVLGKE